MIPKVEFLTTQSGFLECFSGCVPLLAYIWINLNRLSSHLCILIFASTCPANICLLSSQKPIYLFCLTLTIFCCPSLQITRCQLEGNARACFSIFPSWTLKKHGRVCYRAVEKTPPKPLKPQEQKIHGHVPMMHLEE